MKKAIGIAILVSVFGVIFVGNVYLVGLVETLITFGVAILLGALVALGTWLATE